MLKLFKKIAQRHFPIIGFYIHRILKCEFEIFPPRFIFIINKKLHKWVKREFTGNSGFFVEIGANNGLSQSNTAYLEKYCGWKGILVEAIPHKFIECKHNRNKSDVYHAAAVPFNFNEEYIKLKYCSCMSIMDDSSLTKYLNIKEHIESGAKDLGVDEDIAGMTFFAPTITMDKIFQRHNYPKIDFFSLDVEGYELEVLMGIDFSKIDIDVFLIEARNVSVVEEYLAKHEYYLDDKITHHDYVFRKKKK